MRRSGVHVDRSLPRGLLEYYGMLPLRSDAAVAPAEAGPAAVQAKSDGSESKKDTELIHEAAAHGTSGPAGALPYMNQLQQSFGRHDVSHIKAHTGSQATAGAQAMGAEAFTIGEQVAFAGSPSLHVVAHEAAHVIQQRAGVQLKGGIGERGDRYEQHADAVADLVVQGKSSAALLDEFAGAGQPYADAHRGQGPVQRFESDEHARIGDNAARDKNGKAATVELAPGYSVTNGELVAMAGDFFSDLDQMRAYAARPGPGAGTREEIEYVRKVKVRNEPDSGFSPEAKQAVDARYYRLAANNAVHFPNARTGDSDKADRTRSAPDPTKDPIVLGIRIPPMPKNAIEGYRYYHLRALIEAAQAGAAKTSLDVPMAAEAFGAHFLTDSFSAGHLRTERQSIKDYWDGKVPMFFYNFKGFMAEEIAKQVAAGITFLGLQLRDDVAYDPPTDLKDGAKQSVAQKLDAIGPLGFGDLVSGALHDYDNTHGVKATVQGADVTLYGDGKAGQGDEERLATTAAGLGRAEVTRAYTLGASSVSPNDVVHQLLGRDQLYQPERMLPRAKPDAEQASDQKKIQWHTPSYEGLLSDLQFGQAATIFAHEKAATIAEATSDLSASERKAVENGIILPLRADPIGTVRKIINWTPTITDSLAGHNTDDHSNDYWQEAKKTQGGLASLTYVQRERLMSHLLRGFAVGDDEDAVLDILKTAPNADARRLIKRFGWDYLYDKIDDGPGEMFKETFPKADYGS
jgi:hypothetical protein